jgi:hypothetical protein
MVEYNSEDEINSFMRRETGKGNEPIRPGDVIEYCNPIFVKGRYVQWGNVQYC